jgi:hypothetical protein
LNTAIDEVSGAALGFPKPPLWMFFAWLPSNIHTWHPGIFSGTTMLLLVPTYSPCGPTAIDSTEQLNVSPKPSLVIGVQSFGVPL